MSSLSTTRWQRAVIALCIVISLATGYGAFYSLTTQPFLQDPAGALLSAERLRTIVSIDDVSIGPDFFDALPGAARTDAQWWQLQQRVAGTLSGKQSVVVRFAGESVAHGQEMEIVRPGLRPIANEVLIFAFCGLAYVAGALFVFMRHSGLAAFLLALDFLSSAVSLFCAGAGSLRQVSLPYEIHRVLIALSATGTLGFLVSTHFLLCFPTAKKFLERLPQWAIASVYGVVLLQCLLVFSGTLPALSTFPVSAVLNVAMTAALIHSFVTERDGFLKLQLGFLLAVIVSGFAALYPLYVFAPLIQIEPLQPAHVALMFLVGLFAFTAVFENVMLYDKKRQAESKANMEREHLREELHNNMLNRLANIALLSDAALRDNGGVMALDKVAAIKREASSSSRYARGLLRISDERCSWDDFFSHLRQYGHESVADHDLDFELIVNPAAAPREAPLPVKTCLYKIFIEALANTVKYAGARKVWMTAEVDGSWVECRYADDGRGFHPGQIDAGGYGLLHIRRCAEDVSGTLAIETAPGAGMSLTVRIPL